MDYQFIYNTAGDAVGVEIDNVFYKIVGVEYKQNGQKTAVTTANARTPTQAEIQALALQKAGSLDTYIFNNASSTGVQTVKTQEKNSFWEGFTADKVFTGIVSAVTSIFGNKSQTQTVDPSVYGTNPYLTPAPQSNNNYLIIIVIAAFFLFFFKGDKKNN